MISIGTKNETAFKTSVIITVIMLFILCVSDCKKQSSSSKVVEQKIQILTEKLQIGTSHEDVKPCLEASNIEYRYDEDSNCFYGIIRDVKKSGFVSESISIVVQMGEGGKVSELTVKSVYTGP